MESKGSKLKLVLTGVIALLFLYLSVRFKALMGNADFSAFLKWWAALFVLGIGFMPLTMVMFKNFRDKGWLFAKTIGLAVSGWLVWFLSSAHILKFTLANCYAVTAVCFVCNFAFAGFALIRDKKNNSNKTLEARYTFGKFDTDTLFSICMSEFVFYAGFLFWTYLRCFKPEILGNTEKFMDYGLMTSIDRAIYMPAEDIWYSGNTINYYYLGQYLSVFVKRLSGVAIEDSYTLALMMIAGFAVAMPYSLANQVTSDFVKRERVSTRGGKVVLEETPEKWMTQLVGILAGISVCFAGNMHYTIVNGAISGKIEWLKTLLSIERTSYWFPDATRYIGYTPDTQDKTIHEFPSYSFVLGDLHAHVINIMFVLTVLAILYTILQARRARMDSFRHNGFDSITGYDWKDKASLKEMILKEVLTPQIILLGFFIGFFHMTNFWDFPIYFVVSGAIILFSNAVICRFRKETLILTAIHAVVIIVISKIVSLPFTLTFNQISTGVALCVAHTPLYQLAVLWGLPITVVITFLVVMIKKLNKQLKKHRKRPSEKNKPNQENQAISKFCEEHPGFDWLYRMINSLEIPDLFILTIGLCAIGLVLMPELVYVKDIYSGAYKRANTMFKLTYQAFIMFGISMPYIMGRLLRFGEFKRQKVFSIVTMVLLVTTFGYFFNATTAWFGDYHNQERYKGLDCTAFMESYYPEDEKAIDWLNENIKKPVHILEGVGFSYTYYGRVSVMTGNATIMGWETHEWLWRSGAEFAKPEEIPVRQSAVKTVYTSEDRDAVLAVLEQYDVDYIYVGTAERYDGMNKGSADSQGYVRNSADGYYYMPQEVNDELIRSLGEIVYQDTFEGSDKTESGEYRTYIVKVNKTWK